MFSSDFHSKSTYMYHHASTHTTHYSLNALSSPSLMQIALFATFTLEIIYPSLSSFCFLVGNSPPSLFLAPSSSSSSLECFLSAATVDAVSVSAADTCASTLLLFSTVASVFPSNFLPCSCSAFSSSSTATSSSSLCPSSSFPPLTNLPPLSLLSTSITTLPVLLPLLLPPLFFILSFSSFLLRSSLRCPSKNRSILGTNSSKSNSFSAPMTSLATMVVRRPSRATSLAQAVR
mmetsp:Transcript_19865/g.33846  ORF Transcript_19865/g.33846 Transcript_19865/m.33846 type:complete len:233 (-) Transcript_19865:366-1064(-)